MNAGKKLNAALALQKLAADLKDTYSKVGKHIGDTLSPVAAAVAEIDEPWRPPHYAEALQNSAAAGAFRPSTCFAHERFANGDEADYVLCVARDADRGCGLKVSVCKYRLTAPKDGSGGTDAKTPKVAIKDMPLAAPEDLPIPLRVKALDVLDEFVEAYEEHVRATMQGLLAHCSGEKTCAATTVELPPAVPDPPKKQRPILEAEVLPEPAPEQKEGPIPEAEIVAEIEERPEAPEEKPEPGDKKEKSKTEKAASGKMTTNIPLEAWV